MTKRSEAKNLQYKDLITITFQTTVASCQTFQWPLFLYCVQWIKLCPRAFLFCMCGVLIFGTATWLVIGCLTPVVSEGAED